MQVSEDTSRAVAGGSWVLLGAGAAFLVSAAATDSGQIYDTVSQSTNAWIAVGLLAAAVPVGVGALVLDRPHRQGGSVPGEARHGIRHPRALALSLAAAAIVAGVLALIVGLAAAA
jgi:hypothetical protein